MKNHRIYVLLVVLLIVGTAGAWVPERKRLMNNNDTLRYDTVQSVYDTLRTNSPIRKVVQNVQNAQAVGVERKELKRVPVILVNYKNMAIRVNRADVDSMFSAQHYNLNGATGSVRQYFYDQSMGKYNPQFDIYGPVTVSQNYAYYGAGYPDAHPSELVLEACALMDDSLDFSLYDANNDGKVDLVFVIFAGPGQNDGSDCIGTKWSLTDLIWPHYWTIDQAGAGGKNRVFDGKKVNEYEVSAELDGCLSNATTTAHICGIGLACHEFCHGLGLIDIYNQSVSNKTLGVWDIMDYGIYSNDLMTPPNLSAYERWYMGWLEPEILNTPTDGSLPALGTGNTAYVVTANGTKPSNIISPNPATFYLLENRQQIGWDSYCPGHGLLITKIAWTYSKWSNNSPNGDPNNMGIDILEADGLAPSYNANNTRNGYFGKQGDCFPTASVNSWTLLNDYPVTDIQESQGVITFRFMGGGTGTNTINANADEQANWSGYKRLKNGRIIVIRQGVEYDILGNTL